jgi:hypothetical protein
MNKKQLNECHQISAEYFLEKYGHRVIATHEHIPAKQTFRNHFKKFICLQSEMGVKRKAMFKDYNVPYQTLTSWIKEKSKWIDLVLVADLNEV